MFPERMSELLLPKTYLHFLTARVLDLDRFSGRGPED